MRRRSVSHHPGAAVLDSFAISSPTILAGRISFDYARQRTDRLVLTRKGPRHLPADQRQCARLSLIQFS